MHIFGVTRVATYFLSKIPMTPLIALLKIVKIPMTPPVIPIPPPNKKCLLPMQNTGIMGSTYGYLTPQPQGVHICDWSVLFFNSFYPYSFLVYLKWGFMGIRHISFKGSKLRKTDFSYFFSKKSKHWPSWCLEKGLSPVFALF